MVPAFTGLGAPHWAPDARGLFTGMTLDTERDHLITATLASVAYQTVELVEAVTLDGADVGRLRVDGGMVVNDWLCQFLADVIDRPVERPVNVETTALGAAVLAAVGRWGVGATPVPVDGKEKLEIGNKIHTVMTKISFAPDASD